MLKHISNASDCLIIKNKFDHYFRSTKRQNKLKNAIMSQKKFLL